MPTSNRSCPQRGLPRENNEPSNKRHRVLNEDNVSNSVNWQGGSTPQSRPANEHFGYFWCGLAAQRFSPAGKTFFWQSSLFSFRLPPSLTHLASEADPLNEICCNLPAKTKAKPRWRQIAWFNLGVWRPAAKTLLFGAFSKFRPPPPYPGTARQTLELEKSLESSKSRSSDKRPRKEKNLEIGKSFGSDKKDLEVKKA